MKNFSISKLAETVLSQRKHLNLTQQDLADRAGINRSMLCRLENQDYIPSLDQLTRLANTLQFDVGSVFIEYTAPVFHHVVPRNISVFGAGYVGLSIATLLARHHQVILMDKDPEKVKKINNRISPVRDEYIEKHFAKAELHLTAVANEDSACESTDFAVIAVPTRYDPKGHSIDASPVDAVIQKVISSNPDAIIVIKSTVPIGFTASISKKYGTKNILVSPEFLRKSNALYDNLYPSRIIVGCDVSTRKQAEIFAGLLQDSALKKEVDVLLMGLTEAEAVKHFSDTYLALRSSFFNEVDTYSEDNKLNAWSIIQGVCLDPQIGSQNSNPSFCCDSLCVPQSISQLAANPGQFPLYMTSAVIESNQARKQHIVERILEQAGIQENSLIQDDVKKITAGIFRFPVQTEVNDISRKPIQDIMESVKGKGISIIVYEPCLEDGLTVLGNKVVNDLRKFKKQSNIIIADRYDSCLDDVRSKVYTRDLHF